MKYLIFILLLLPISSYATNFNSDADATAVAGAFSAAGAVSGSSSRSGDVTSATDVNVDSKNYVFNAPNVANQSYGGGGSCAVPVLSVGAFGDNNDFAGAVNLSIPVVSGACIRHEKNMANIKANIERKKLEKAIYEQTFVCVRLKETMTGVLDPLYKLFNSQCEGLLTELEVDIVESDLAISLDQ